jgi:NAD(P)H-hydrate epimerase
MPVPAVMSRDQVRDVDRRAIDDYGLPGVVLMENAGRGCVDWLLELGVAGRVVICAGRGNNGGDGFVIARHLANRGKDVCVLLFCDPTALQGDAAINCRVIERSSTKIRVITSALSDDDLNALFSGADWIVDALLGTGTRGSLRDPFPAIIQAINRSPARTLAIDLPSGLDCDSGIPIDPSEPIAVRADFTATFVASKSGFLNPAAVPYTGEIRIIDIGVPHSMFD